MDLTGCPMNTYLADATSVGNGRNGAEDDEALHF